MRFNVQEKKEQASIHIYGIIGIDEAYWDEGTNNKAFALVKIIKALDKKYERINVHINSPGGIIDDGLAIYNALKSAKADIHTYNDGVVASMAGIIMLGGTTHYPKTSIHHLHRASTIAIGNINDFENAIEQLEVFENVLISAIQEKTKMSVEEIKAKWFNGKDHFLTAEQAHEFGFVDVYEDEIEVDAPENISNLTYKELYNNYRKEAAPDKGFFQKVAAFLNQNKPEYKFKNTKKMKLKRGIAFLLAIFALSELEFNEEGKAEFTADEVIQINDELEANSAEIDKLKAEKEKAEKERDEFAEQVLTLKTKLEKTPSDNAVNTKTADNTKPNKEEVADAETTGILVDHLMKKGV